MAQIFNFLIVYTIQVQPLRSTRSSSTLTLLRPPVTSSLKVANRSIAIAVPPLWNKLSPVLRQISNPSHELTKTSPLAISPQVFHSKLKHCYFTNPIPIPSPPLPRHFNFKNHPP